MRKILLLPIFVTLLWVSCMQNKTYFEKKVEFPNKISDKQKIKLAAYVTPTPRQLEWQKLELKAFIHFGINTFSNKEWGHGTESPLLFNPENLDAEQWVTTLQKAGFKMIILTAKHHDGFCLWPTKTTQYSVASSPWRDGQGDVVRELKDACDKYEIKFGVYLSPWDRNAQSYGNSPKYNEFFIAQLSELLSNYGEIHEVWFDGANGEGVNGKKQKYDWKAIYQTIDSLQPQAVKAIMGDDVRWVGNEKGFGRETEWSVTPLQPDINEKNKTQNDYLGIAATSDDLGSRELIAKAKRLYWYPSEVDVSIRPGWFYHPEQNDKVKSLKELVDIYFQSVGMNSVLLLNVPPDTRGLIHENDRIALSRFGEYIDETFKENKIVDQGNTWQARKGDFKEFTLKFGSTINTLMLQENIVKGQRVEMFKVEALSSGVWTKIAEGTTIGYKRLLQFDSISPKKIRVTIIKTRDKANIKNVGAYYAALINEKSATGKLNDVDKSEWTIISTNPSIIDLGELYSIESITYSPPQKDEKIFNYNLSISKNGKDWMKIKQHAEFSNVKNNPIPQFVAMEKDASARYILLETLQGTEGGIPAATINQIGILTK